MSYDFCSRLFRSLAYLVNFRSFKSTHITWVVKFQRSFITIWPRKLDWFLLSWSLSVSLSSLDWSYFSPSISHLIIVSCLDQIFLLLFSCIIVSLSLCLSRGYVYSYSRVVRVNLASGLIISGLVYLFFFSGHIVDSRLSLWSYGRYFSLVL